jgi:hypothetical protein
MADTQALSAMSGPPTPEPPSSGFDSGRLAIGVAIILFGVLLLVGRTMQLDWLERGGWWPFLVIAYGVARMVSEKGYRFSHGLAFALIGVWGLLNNLDVLHYEDSWPLLFVIIGGSLVVGSFTRGWTAEAATPATAATYDLTTREGRRAARRARYGRRDGLGFIWIFVVWGIIFSFAQGNGGFVRRQRDTRYEAAGFVRRAAVMSQSRGIYDGTPFEGADLTAVMGECDLDLTHAVLAAGQVPVINVHVVMGQVNLRVPNDWIVEQRLTPVMGNTEDYRRKSTADIPATADSEPKRIIVRGGVVMGEFDIRN